MAKLSFQQGIDETYKLLNEKHRKNLESSPLDFTLDLSSAYRDFARNKRAGGVPNSKHLTGDAFDISTKKLTPEQRSKAHTHFASLGYKVIDEGDHLHVQEGGGGGGGHTHSHGRAPAKPMALGQETALNTMGGDPMMEQQQKPNPLLGMLGEAYGIDQKPKTSKLGMILAGLGDLINAGNRGLGTSDYTGNLVALNQKSEQNRREGLKALLSATQKTEAGTDDIQEFNFARQQGFGGSFQDWMAQVKQDPMDRMFLQDPSGFMGMLRGGIGGGGSAPTTPAPAAPQQPAAPVSGQPATPVPQASPSTPASPAGMKRYDRKTGRFI